MSLQKTVKLANPEARVPWPGVPGRLLPAEPFVIDLMHPFFSALLADGSLVDAADLVEAEEPAPAPVKSKS